MRVQITDTLMMVRPANFGFNEQTASSNAFQQAAQVEDAEIIKNKAIQEFDDFVRILRAHGIDVIVVEDTPSPVKPDAVFPNNWVSFHADGTVMLYPMMAEVRRLERRKEIIDQVGKVRVIAGLVDFSHYESENRFLEGTGSLILDREHRIVYACVGPRTDTDLLDRFCEHTGYRKVQFHAVDAGQQDIYHTNVVMALGETFVVICMDTILDEDERSLVTDFFQQTQKEIILISLDQMAHFAGNMLQVCNRAEETYLVMSEQAFGSLTPEQVSQIGRNTNILSAPLYNIETYGGGSARCMMAEVFLPRLAE